MDAAFIIYFSDNDGYFYCFKHAVKALSQGKDVEIDGRDYSNAGNDCRTTPQCFVCGKKPLKIDF